MKRSNFKGRKIRRQYVAGQFGRDEYTKALEGVKRTRLGVTAVARDPKLAAS